MKYNRHSPNKEFPMSQVGATAGQKPLNMTAPHRRILHEVHVWRDNNARTGGVQNSRTDPAQ